MRDIAVPDDYLPPTACLAEAIAFRALAAEVRGEGMAGISSMERAAEVVGLAEQGLISTQKYDCETPLYMALVMSLGDFLRLGLGFLRGGMDEVFFQDRLRTYAESADELLGFALAESSAAAAEGRHMDMAAFTGRTS